MPSKCQSRLQFYSWLTNGVTMLCKTISVFKTDLRKTFNLRQCFLFQGLAVEINMLSPLMWIKVAFRKWNFYSISSPISTKARISNISFVVKLLYIICAEINIYIYNGDCEEDGLGGYLEFYK